MKSVTISGTAEEITAKLKNASKRFAGETNDENFEKGITIRGAALRGEFLNYSYDITVAKGTTDTIPTRKGGLLVHDDVKAAFQKLHAHLAVRCEEIAADKIGDIDNIEKYNDEEHEEGSLEHFMSHYSVEAFKIHGNGDNQSVELIGAKRLSDGELVGLTSPKIPFDGLYPFINELRVSIDDLIFEVNEYMNGKTRPQFVQPTIPGIDDAPEDNTELD